MKKLLLTPILFLFSCERTLEIDNYYSCNKEIMIIEKITTTSRYSSKYVIRIKDRYIILIDTIGKYSIGQEIFISKKK